MSRWFFLSLAVVALLLSLNRAAATPVLQWWTTNSLVKIHPFDAEPVDAGHAVKIKAARNEFEPFQVVLRAEGQDIGGTDIEVTDLRGKTAVLPAEHNISIYLERYIDVKLPSSVAGGTGEWPDPLVPRVDRYANEKRNAFPFRLVRHQNQAIWIDVYVPLSMPAGVYKGRVRVSIAGELQFTIPLDLEVWNFQLPSTSSLATSFGFSGNAALSAHYGRYTNENDMDALTHLYQQAGLWHRITLDGSAGVFPLVAVTHDGVQVNWDKYDYVMTPFLDGHLFSTGQPLYGGRATSVALHTPPVLRTPEQQIQFWRQAAAHFRARAWFDRLFDYIWDEPNPKDFPAMVKLGEIVRRADPKLKNLVTAPLHSEWSNFIDIWAPNINCFERKPNYSNFCNPTVERSGYDPVLKTGKQLWWYQACGSHGCDIVGGNYFRGWPSYMIDDAPVRNRIMEWLTWKYGIQGELYFSTTEAYAKKTDPWNDVYLFGGNGDGTLFYPGRPELIGGTTHIPIESIRLKLIREGLEDYEYFAMLKRLAGDKVVTDVLNAFIRRTYDYDQEPKKLYAARDWMGQEISRLSTH